MITLIITILCIHTYFYVWFSLLELAGYAWLIGFIYFLHSLIILFGVYKVYNNFFNTWINPERTVEEDKLIWKAEVQTNFWYRGLIILMDLIFGNVYTKISDRIYYNFFKSKYFEENHRKWTNYRLQNYQIHSYEYYDEKMFHIYLNYVLLKLHWQSFGGVELIKCILFWFVHRIEYKISYNYYYYKEFVNSNSSTVRFYRWLYKIQGGIFVVDAAQQEIMNLVEENRKYRIYQRALDKKWRERNPFTQLRYCLLRYVVLILLFFPTKDYFYKWKVLFMRVKTNFVDVFLKEACIWGEDLYGDTFNDLVRPYEDANLPAYLFDEVQRPWVPNINVPYEVMVDEDISFVNPITYMWNNYEYQLKADANDVYILLDIGYGEIYRPEDFVSAEFGIGFQVYNPEIDNTCMEFSEELLQAAAAGIEPYHTEGVEFEDWTILSVNDDYVISYGIFDDEILDWEYILQYEDCFEDLYGRVELFNINCYAINLSGFITIYLFSVGLLFSFILCSRELTIFVLDQIEGLKFVIMLVMVTWCIFVKFSYQTTLYVFLLWVIKYILFLQFL